MLTFISRWKSSRRRNLPVQSSGIYKRAGTLSLKNTGSMTPNIKRSLPIFRVGLLQAWTRLLLTPRLLRLLKSTMPELEAFYMNAALPALFIGGFGPDTAKECLTVISLLISGVLAMVLLISMSIDIED